MFEPEAQVPGMSFYRKNSLKNVSIWLFLVHIEILRTDMLLTQGKNSAPFEDFGKELFRKVSV